MRVARALAVQKEADCQVHEDDDRVDQDLPRVGTEYLVALGVEGKLDDRSVGRLANVDLHGVSNRYLGEGGTWT